MEMTVQELMNAGVALGNLAKQKLPSRGAYWIARTLGKLRPELQAVEERRIELVKKYGEPVGATSQQYEVKGEINVRDYLKEFGEILAEKINVDVQPFSFAVLGDAEIAAADILDLGPLVILPDGVQ